MAIEIWTIDQGYVFDGLYLGTSAEEAQAYRKEVWGPKYKAEVRLACAAGWRAIWLVAAGKAATPPPRHPPRSADQYLPLYTLHAPHPTPTTRPSTAHVGTSPYKMHTTQPTRPMHVRRS